MVLDKLSTSLKETIKKIAGSIFIDEKLINDIIKDIQRALLQSDVDVQLVLDLTNKIKNRALKEKIDNREKLIQLIYQELTNFLGEEKSDIKIVKKKPFKIMMVGLFGSGKTTTIGKLANYYKKRGYKIAALGLDIHRPAAPEQLKQICDKIKIPFFIDKNEKDIIKIYNKYLDEFNKYDILIIDTAGRDALSSDLIEELERLNKLIKPDENLLIISADIGQAARKQIEQFHKSGRITGIILTKLDGTARGGGALSAAAITAAKIKFIGVGEKIDDLEIFNPKGFVGRLLGMGDLDALLEKAREAVSEEEAEDLGKKFLKGEFNFLDLYDQMKAMSKMGPLSKLIDMIPGLGGFKIPKDILNVQEDKLKKWKFIMQSMTKKELENPEIIDRERIDRIAKGTGVNTSEVRELLKQYKKSKKVMKLLKGKDPEKLMKKFKGKLPI